MTGEPLLLAFDTSTPLGSVAVARGRDVLARGFLTRKGEHGVRLVPLIGRVLEEAGTSRTELAGLVVGRGPGSFTGVRITAATAKGLVRGLDCPLWLYSSLAAGAASMHVDVPDSRHDDARVRSVSPPDTTEPDAPGTRYVLFDARADRVYAGCYRISDTSVEELAPPHASTIGAVLEADPPPGAAFCGDGALRHAETIAAAGHRVLGRPAGVPTAGGLLRIHGLIGEEATAELDSAWEPDYLRSSSARKPVSVRESAG